jgi:hypothetical protein
MEDFLSDIVISSHPVWTKTWSPWQIIVSDWLISKISSSLELLGQMNRNLVGSILE